VSHHPALFDDNKNNCPTVRGGHGFVDLWSRVLQVCVFSYMKSALRYTFLILDTYHPVTLVIVM